MVKYRITENGNVLTILGSYAIPKAKFQAHLNSIKALHRGCPVFQRSDASLRREWGVHNALYVLHIARSRTADVDFESKQFFLLRIMYSVGNFLLSPFIK